MSPFNKLHRIIRPNVSMARHTSLRVGGTVAWFAEPETIEQFSLVHRTATEAGYRIRILGRGCNVVVADDHHPGSVVISTRKLDRYRRSGNQVHCDAGVGLPRLVALAEQWGLGGLEPLAGIPGTVGGAITMNAGGHLGTIGDRLLRALVAYPGEPPREVPAGELALGYRTSIFRGGAPCLLGATFQLDTAAIPRLERTRRELLARRKATQPMSATSAGCIFKNPPDGPPAGLLIDRAGLKGESVGGAEVSRVHANFIVNRGNATATDIFDLIDLVGQRVHQTSGVWLDLEVELWRPAPPPSQALARRRARAAKGGAMAPPEKTRVAVLYGGRSSERNVSLKTGAAVGKALADAGYPVAMIDTREVDPRTLDPAGQDVVFIALHGEFGEDGGVQQILDDLGIPYTGSGVRASRVAMDKLQTKVHFERAGVPTPRYRAIHRHWPAEQCLATATSLGLPVILKPASEGSSVGVHLVRSQADLADALGDAFRFGTTALAEVFLPGRELTVGILDERPLPIIQLNYKGPVFNFHNKYTPGATRHVIRPHLPPGVAEQVTSISLAAHRSLGCRGITRVDLRLDARDRPFVLEVNTIPGMTETSLIPDAARAAGVSFTRVCELAIDMALARATHPVGV